MTNPTSGCVTTGQALPPFTIDVTAGAIKTVAAVLRDPVPIHFDVEAVRALGLGDRLVNQGPINVGYLLEFVSRFAGTPEAVLNLRVRFLGSIYAGDRVTCTGSVMSLDDDEGTALLELTARTRGEPVLSGSAVIALSRIR